MVGVVRVTVGPFTEAEVTSFIPTPDVRPEPTNAVEAITRIADDHAAQRELIERFAPHIEEPTDAVERGTVWIAAVMVAYTTALNEFLESLKTPPPNRAARRHQN
jgi:hypothetical protein